MSYGSITNPREALRWALADVSMDMTTSLSEVKLPETAQVRVVMPDTKELRGGLHYMIFKLWPLLNASERRRVIEIRRTKFDSTTHYLLLQLVYAAAAEAKKRFQQVLERRQSGSRRFLPADRQRAILFARLAAVAVPLLANNSRIRRRTTPNMTVRPFGTPSPFGIRY